MNTYDLQQAQAFFAAKLSYTTGVHELDYLVQQSAPDTVVVDVRLPSDYAKGHVPGAVNLPKGRWNTAKGLRKDATHYLYCYSQTCHLAAEAAVELIRAGYKVVEVEGGWATWQAGGYAAEVQAA